MALRYRDIQPYTTVVQICGDILAMRLIWFIDAPVLPPKRRRRAKDACHYYACELPSGEFYRRGVCMVKNIARWADRLATEEEMQRLLEIRTRVKQETPETY